MEVLPIEDGRYAVTVTEGDLTTHHEVDVPPECPAALEVEGTAGEVVAGESIGFLLDRFPLAELPDTIGVDELQDRYPEYPEELRRRVTAT